MSARTETIAFVLSMFLASLLATRGVGQEDAGPTFKKDQDHRTEPPRANGGAANHELHFVVVKAFADDLLPRQRALMEEVVRVLEREKPENPGRKKTFGRMWFRGSTPENRHLYLLTQSGWILTVLQAVPLPSGGWRATVAVRASVHYLEDGRQTVVANQHFEIYVLRDGKLTLEEDFVDPDLGWVEPPYDLTQGLLPALRIAGTTIPLDLGPVPKAPPPDPFVVRIELEGKPVKAQPKLAKEVQRVLRDRKPENSNRTKSFPKEDYPWRFPDGHVERWKLRFMGWHLTVRKVESIPGGWQATVHVGATLQTSSGFQPMLSHHHTEIYTFKDGKLKLQSESIDPNHDHW